ncbi:hypothetical protein R1sor_009142 [Riccia sorocarpa]|uniref:Uncharacterized protein n=1 Tax=Riccia sorocarpa TaxID=122646 RepID=A0ABD3H4X6_9MARC
MATARPIAVLSLGILCLPRVTQKLSASIGNGYPGQTRMIHKERWIEFARYGSAFYALRSISTLDLERMIVENRAENYMNKFRFYEPLPCMNEKHDHYCPPGCNIVDGHICRVCSPAANTAQQTHLLVKQAGADQVIDPLYTGWNYGFHKIEELPDPMSLRYKPNIWYPGTEMVDLEALGRSAFVMTESTPTPVGTVGTIESIPSGEASSRGANITPSGEESSRGANITPSGEGSSQGANITPSGESSSRGADVTSSGKGTSPETVTDVPGQVVEHGREPVESPLTPSQLEIVKRLEILMRFQRFGNVPPMQVPETHYSHRINLANYDIEGKSDARIRIAVAELLTEVEREVRQAGSIYFRILHKIFVGAGGDVPRYDEACEWIANKYVEMQVRCRNLTNTEYRLLNDLRELQPTAEALKHLQHRQKELRYVVEKLTLEVKILRRQKVALAVSVRSTVSYEGEGEHVLGIFAENEELKEQVAQLKSELESRGDCKHGTSIFTCSGPVGPASRVLGVPVAEDLAFMFSSLPRRQQSDLQSEYLRKVTDARMPRLTDVEAALEATERKHQAEHDEWAKRKPPLPDEEAKRKPRPLVPQSGHAVEKDGMAEVLLQAARDPEMEAMPGSNLQFGGGMYLDDLGL